MRCFAGIKDAVAWLAMLFIASRKIHKTEGVKSGGQKANVSTKNKPASYVSVRPLYILSLAFKYVAHEDRNVLRAIYLRAGEVEVHPSVLPGYPDL